MMFSAAGTRSGREWSRLVRVFNGAACVHTAPPEDSEVRRVTARDPALATPYEPKAPSRTHDETTR